MFDATRDCPRQCQILGKARQASRCSRSVLSACTGSVVLNSESYEQPFGVCSASLNDGPCLVPFHTRCPAVLQQRAVGGQAVRLSAGQVRARCCPGVYRLSARSGRDGISYRSSRFFANDPFTCGFCTGFLCSSVCCYCRSPCRWETPQRFPHTRACEILTILLCSAGGQQPCLPQLGTERHLLRLADHNDAPRRPGHPRRCGFVVHIHTDKECMRVLGAVLLSVVNQSANARGMRVVELCAQLRRALHGICCWACRVRIVTSPQPYQVGACQRMEAEIHTKLHTNPLGTSPPQAR